MFFFSFVRVRPFYPIVFFKLWCNTSFRSERAAHRCDSFAHVQKFEFESCLGQKATFFLIKSADSRVPPVILCPRQPAAAAQSPPRQLHLVPPVSDLGYILLGEKSLSKISVFLKIPASVLNLQN
jgi:hypothetical protein